MQDYLFRGDLTELDPELEDLTQIETERQYRKIILIPSESTAPLAVRALLGSAFQNIYAEGYPPEPTRKMTESEILDLDARLAEYRRYSDPRYYKGVEYADVVEELARRRCAEAFSTETVSADDLYVNVQALSGAPANNAVYHALIEPGDTILGMNLLHGGHLTHGSPVNRSGKLYHAVHYTVDHETEQIDYDAVQALATEHKPKVIVAGYSSYPWSVDWNRFRQIADSVGAYLLADIAHVAGLVAAGVYPSPVGIADVITFTTHKSLCGPRGAAILTTSRKLSRAIDRAVFPGEQGGPHINNIVAQALAFKLATTDQFKKLQTQILTNAKVLADTLEKAGFRLSFGGTDTHMLNIDCKSIVGQDGTPLSGDLAARILDVAGIVTNRNTIPGDRSAFDASGIRMGTPWITQRGFKEKDVQALGEAIAELLKACKPYSQLGRKGPEKRAKVDFETLNRVKIKVRELAQAAGFDGQVEEHGYPHFYYLDQPQPEAPFVTLELAEDAAEAILQWVTDIRPVQLETGNSLHAQVFTPSGPVEAVIEHTGPATWKLTVPSESAVMVMTWLRDLSDGYISMDDDLHRKAPGPFTVRQIDTAESMPEAEKQSQANDKPWYLGAEGSGKALPEFEWTEPEDVEMRRTALYEVHKELGGKIIPFAGWEMPVWYTSVLEEHLATRQAAGLFDVSHMGVYQVEGPQAAAFLDSVVTNDIAALEVGESCYTQFLDPGAH
ncbi:MAG: serine hydroxymethyltransferase, partial [Anaerolineales bacterium]